MPLEQHYEFKILNIKFIKDVNNDKSKVTHLEHPKSSFPLFFFLYFSLSRFQRPRVLRRRSAAARLMSLWVRIPPGFCML